MKALHILALILFILPAWLILAPGHVAGQNPTPILITLTPAPSDTPANITATPVGHGDGDARRDWGRQVGAERRTGIGQRRRLADRAGPLAGR